MGFRFNSMAPILRRLAAAVVVVALAVSSFGGLKAEPSLGPAPGHESVAKIVNPDKDAHKPCQRAVLPGAANSCQLANTGFAGIPCGDLSCSLPDLAVQGLRWGVADSRLSAQCGGSSLYRPPCSIA